MSTISDLNAANPYKGAAKKYWISPWQDFLSLLGIRTKSDAWRENMYIQEKEYDAAIAQKQYDEEYNLPVNQVARMRAAGLNPDISGGDGIDSGSAAPLGEDPSTPMQSTGDEETIMNFANGVFSLFSTAIGLTSGVQGVVRNRLENNLLSIQGESSLAQFAEQMFPFFLPNTPDPEIGEDGSVTSWQSRALGQAQLFTRGMPKKMQDRFLTQIYGYWNSAPGEAKSYDEWKNRVTSRKGYYNEKNYMYSESDEVLQIISSEFQEMNEKIAKMQQDTAVSGEEAQQAQNENIRDYATALDGTLQGETENAENKVKKQNAEMVGIMRDSLSNMIKGLEKLSNEPGFKGGIASTMMALLSMFQLYISSQGMPSVRSSSMQSSGTGYGKGLYQNQSTSKSIGIDF